MVKGLKFYGGMNKEKLKEINTAIITPCPQLGCNCIVTETIFKKTLKNNSLEYKTYLKCILKNFTDFNSVIKACPFPGCESYVHCEKKGNTEEQRQNAKTP